MLTFLAFFGIVWLTYLIFKAIKNVVKNIHSLAVTNPEIDSTKIDKIIKAETSDSGLILSLDKTKLQKGCDAYFISTFNDDEIVHVGDNIFDVVIYNELNRIKYSYFSPVNGIFQKLNCEKNLLVNVCNIYQLPFSN